MTIDEAIRALRNDPGSAALVRDAYLGRDVVDSIERFCASAEFAAVQALLGNRIAGATILDLGAGIGMASVAFRRAGAARVIAIEPDDSDEVGRGAMARGGVEAEVVSAFGEELPIPGGSIDIVYARQVLHHAQDLEAILREIARILRPGGAFVACREHVISNDEELRAFLAAHPVNRLAGGENAFPLDRYRSAILGSGLRLEAQLGPWDSVINTFPLIGSDAELRAMAQDRLVRRFGRAGALLARIPGVQAMVRRRIQPMVPGRVYTCLAVKP